MVSQEDLQKMLADAGADAGASGDADAPQLRITSGQAQGQVFDLAGGQSSWTIGSGAECDIRLGDDGVSRLHAEIKNEGGRWKVTDQMSANGTFVNDDKAVSGYLGSGDQVRFGSVQAVVEGLGTASTGKAKSAPAAAAQADTGGGGGGSKVIIAVVVVAVVAAGAFFLLG